MTKYIHTGLFIKHGGKIVPYKMGYGIIDNKLIEWSKKVKERDNYTCQNCGNKKGVCAHHIIPVNLPRDVHSPHSPFPASYYNPALALDVNNGITLCRECHTHLHRGLKPFCPFCHSYNIYHHQRKKNWKCVYCGKVFDVPLDIPWKLRLHNPVQGMMPF